MRIALGIEYNGMGYHGWQAQQGLPTVQGTLQSALSHIANEEIFTHCAGRTDANVHATGQVVHFDTSAKRHIDAWIYGVNAKLPDSVGVRWAQHVDYSFHARFKANSRRYRYIIYNHPIRPTLLNGRVAWHYYPLDEDKMRQASSFLIGEQDFSSFRASQCGSKTPMRNIMDVTIERKGEFILLEIEANAFLHHMVRNVAGTLMKIGEGNRPVDWMAEVIEARSRQAAAETAPAGGLYLMQVSYPCVYNFPPSQGPVLL